MTSRAAAIVPPLLGRWSCGKCGTLTIEERADGFVAVCCGWRLPRRMVERWNGWAQPNAGGRLELAKAAGQVPDETYFRQLLGSAS